MSSMDTHDRIAPTPDQAALLAQLTGRPDTRRRCVEQRRNYRYETVWEPSPCGGFLSPNGACPYDASHVSKVELEELDAVARVQEAQNAAGIKVLMARQEEIAAQHDPVTNPLHYRSHPSGVECIDIAKHEPYCIGAALKYIWRRKLKGNEIQDLRKAIQHIEFEIARLEGDAA